MSYATAPTQKNFRNANELDEFLSKRDGRVTTIEIANTLYQAIGDGTFISKIHHADLDNFEAGCVLNYFAFSQKILVDFIFMNFITVIGNYDSRNDSLKAWANIFFSSEAEKHTMMQQLKEIRVRYADTRNNFICHINDDLENCTDSVLTKQIHEDIATLRNIFNIIRVSNNLPEVITTFSPSEHYSVIGLSKIFAILHDKPAVQTNTGIIDSLSQ